MRPRLAIGLVFAALLVPAGRDTVAGDAPEEKQAPKDEQSPKEKTREVVAKDLRLQIPESWKQEKATTSMRVAQFEIPPAKGDDAPGELVFYYFQGGAGGVKENLERWIDQVDPDGRKVKLRQGSSTNGNYYLADVTGTYRKPVGRPIQRQTKSVPGSRLLGVVLETKRGMYYIKLTGPEKTIASVAKQFRASFGAKTKEEKELTL